MTLWIVVALCFLRSLRCFLRISLFSFVASIFSLAVVGVLRFLLFSMKFFVSSENLLFLLVMLFYFLPAPISGSVMLLIISFKEMLLLLSSCCSSRAAYRFCRSILNSFTICLHVACYQVLIQPCLRFTLFPHNWLFWKLRHLQTSFLASRYFLLWTAFILDLYSHWKLLYELRSRVVCYPKIKLSPCVLVFCFILCCAYYDASILNYILCILH